MHAKMPGIKILLISLCFFSLFVLLCEYKYLARACMDVGARAHISFKSGVLYGSHVVVVKVFSCSLQYCVLPTFPSLSPPYCNAFMILLLLLLLLSATECDHFFWLVLCLVLSVKNWLALKSVPFDRDAIAVIPSLPPLMVPLLLLMHLSENRAQACSRCSRKRCRLNFIFDKMLYGSFFVVWKTTTAAAAAVAAASSEKIKNKNNNNDGDDETNCEWPYAAVALHAPRWRRPMEQKQHINKRTNKMWNQL